MTNAFSILWPAVRLLLWVGAALALAIGVLVVAIVAGIKGLHLDEEEPPALATKVETKHRRVS